MPPLEAAAVYVGINILLLIYLSSRVVFMRRSAKVSVGHGSNVELELRTRTHGNASEYIPAMMVGLVTAAYMGIPALWIHILGASFTFGRVLHAIGLSRTIFPLRVSGMLLTWFAMILIAGMLIYHGLA
ncbi:MAG: MAPEG family protein [Hyphomonas sp.]|tara:strand:- start:2449 stop:2835 length:387 start_codon:yes stop_codon:yes gene_type:complete